MENVNAYLIISPSYFQLISDIQVFQMNKFQDHMPILFELNLSVIRWIKGFPRIDKYSQTCIHRSLKGTWKYDRYEQLYRGYNNSTIHSVKNKTVLYRLICYIEVSVIDCNLLYRGALHRR